MQVRVECPACGGEHVFHMPEGTIHMTCSVTGKIIELRCTPGGDCRVRLVEEPKPSDRQPS